MTLATRLVPNAEDRTMTAVRGSPLRESVRIAAGKLVPGTRYEVVRWLGEGGMGVVYEAVHVDIDQRVALKILRREYSSDAAVVRLFRQEARATGQLATDAIAQVRDFVELPDGRLMIAMEFLEGRDLHGAIRGPMDPARMIGILRQCCKALAEVHDHGLVHRDVKPENIFLTVAQGRADKVKLLDFGIAMFVDGDASDRLVGGTPGFVAPEAILFGEVGPALDQFALGSVAYAMLTGRPAFSGATVGDIVEASLEPPERPSRADVPPSLVDVVMRCLAYEPADRFPSMREVEAALCRAQIEGGVQTPWDDLSLPDVDPDARAWLLSHMPEPEAGLIAARHRRGLIMAVSVALCLGGTAVVGAVVAVGDTAEQTSSGPVDDLSNRARDAASRALFVYPPPDEPAAETAYQVVRRLEALERNEEASAAAGALRTEFAETLNRLGTTYWEADGGRVFAIAYYEQAVLFSSTVEPAASRAGMSPIGVASLAQRASSADFTSLELVSAEPLTILARDTPEARRDGFAEFRSRRSTRMQTLAQELGQDAPVVLGKQRQTESAVAQERLDEDAGDEPGADVDEDRLREPSGRVAKSEAARIARSGRAAFRRGQDDKARLLYEQALGVDARNLMALSGLRDIAFDRGDFGQAVRYGKRAVRVSPRRASEHSRLGDAYYKTARYDLAVKHYRRAVKLGSSNTKSRLERAKQRLPASSPLR